MTKPGFADALRSHWREYLMEAAGLGLFLLVACLVTAVLMHPSSPVRLAIANDALRRALAGVAMGCTAIGLIYSPWGRRSGAHLNPAVTLTYCLLGGVAGWDGVFYGASQFVGGVVGVSAAHALGGEWLRDTMVKYAATTPGEAGIGAAFAAELAISFGLMLMVLTMSNQPRCARYTGLAAGALIAVYIAVEAPLSGMSMNPARTLASALYAQTWQGIWVYFTAPPLGMMLAAGVYRGRVYCAKFSHNRQQPCLFRCGYA